MKVHDIRERLLELYESNVISENGTVEILGASFIADEPAIFGTPNKEYIEREIKWYESQSLNVADLGSPVPKIWINICDHDGCVNSNYGWCIYSKHNNHQYDQCVNTLVKDRFSRQAIMIYTRPTMHADSKFNGMSDFMCTNTVQVLIRNNAVHMVVNMRSNDVVYGYKNDYAWQKHVQTKLMDKFSLNRGDIHWQVGSLHVYPRHFDLIK